MRGPIASAGRRFLQIFGFALVQSCLLGAAVGALVYHRPASSAHLQGQEEPSYLERVAAQLESFELYFYDWRARELGRKSQRSGGVVLVAVDDEAVASGRMDSRPGVSFQPWPRELLGGIVDRLYSEGARLVLVGELFVDLSPNAQPVWRRAEKTDDDAFRALLERHPEKTVLSFGWGRQKAAAVAPSPVPYKVRLAEGPSLGGLVEPLRRLLAERRAAFVIPQKEGGEALWAGAGSEEEARGLAKEWNAPMPWAVAEVTSADLPFRQRGENLLVALAEVTVEGLPLEKLPVAASLSHPVAPLLSDKLDFGSAVAVPDWDGRVRRVWHLFRYTSSDGRTHVLPSAPLAAAMRLLGTRALRYSAGRLWVGGQFSVPMDTDGSSLVLWEAARAADDGRGSLARALSAWRVLVNQFDAVEGAPAHYRNELDGQAVVLGNTSSYSSDFWYTSIGRVSGSGVVGQSLLNLMRSTGIARAAVRTDFILTICLSVVGSLLALLFGGRIRSFSRLGFYCVSVLAAGALYLMVTRQLLLSQKIWVAAAGPLLAMAVSAFFTSVYAVQSERRIIDFVKSAFGGALLPEIAQKVRSNLAVMRPSRRRVTVFFSDLQDFDRLTRELTPSQLVALLNEYLSEMTQVVRNGRGQIDKYMGGAVSAFWGAPLKQAKHAEKACGAALLMRQVLEKKTKEWQDRFGQQLEFRAGIATGDAVAGDMGSFFESHYTVVGDAVSLSSRLQRDNRYYGTLLLASAATMEAAAGSFLFREVDRVRTGAEGVRPIYELLSAWDGQSAKPESISLYERALGAYYQKKYLEALELFDRCYSQWDDAVAAIYMRRCEYYLDSPPGSDWEGVFEPLSSVELK